MSYIFKGNLCGRLCDDCDENLSNVQVKLYRIREDQPVTVLATANPKNTFAILSDEEVKAKEQALLAETETDEAGGFQLELGEEQDYEGGAFEIGVYIERAPGLDERPDDVEPIQFTITTLQPRWRQTEEEFVAVWEYCIPHRSWCRIRERLDAWVICGRVVTCEERRPLPGATVKAFDADWWQDDPLGEALTDFDGRFRIYYSTADFKQTPFPPIDIEWIGGPDIYFEVEFGGDLIIDEDQADGRQAGREDKGPCFCAGELCAPLNGGPDARDIPHWERVEVFEVDTDFSSHGYAGDNSLVMNGNIDFHGNMPLTNPANNKPLKYRFLIGTWQWPGGTEDPDTIPSVEPAEGNLDPIPDTAIADFTVGYIYYADADGNARSAPVIVTSDDLDEEGCITLLGKMVNVDMFDGTTSDIPIAQDNFVGAYLLVKFNSRYLTPAPHGRLEDLGRSTAGEPVETADRDPIRKYKLRFQVFDADQPVNKSQNNKTLAAMVIDNSPVKWALNLEELESNLCDPVNNELHILFTLDHPHMNSYSIKVENNAGVVHDAPPLPTESFGGDLFFRGASSGSAGEFVNVSGDPSCAYAVIMRWNTRHYGSIGGQVDRQMLYCK